MPKEYHHASHSKYFVFACKYRKKLLGKQNIADEMRDDPGIEQRWIEALPG